MDVNMLDVVELEDGKRVTVVDVYMKDGKIDGYEVEDVLAPEQGRDDEWLMTVEPDQIVKVVQKAK
jgi:hypothetical protein